MSWGQASLRGSNCGGGLPPVHRASSYKGSAEGAAAPFRLAMTWLRALRANSRVEGASGLSPQVSSTRMGPRPIEGFKRFFKIMP